MGFGKVLIDRPFPLDQVRDCVETQRVDAEIEPEPHDIDDGLEHLRVVEIQVWLVQEETMPVVLAGNRIECPVRLFGIDENNSRSRVLLIRVAPYVVIPFGGAFRRPTCTLKPRMLIRRVIDDEFREHSNVLLMGLLDEATE